MINQQSYYLSFNFFNTSCNKQAKNTPKPTNNWLNAPKVPEISFGANYFIINGAIAL